MPTMPFTLFNNLLRVAVKRLELPGALIRLDGARLTPPLDQHMCFSDGQARKDFSQSAGPVDDYVDI